MSAPQLWRWTNSIDTRTYCCCSPGTSAGCRLEARARLSTQANSIYSKASGPDLRAHVMQHEDVVQPQLLPPPFAEQPAVVLKHAHFSWGDGEGGDRGCTLQDISLKVPQEQP